MPPLPYPHAWPACSCPFAGISTGTHRCRPPWISIIKPLRRTRRLWKNNSRRICQSTCRRKSIFARTKVASRNVEISPRSDPAQFYRLNRGQICCFANEFEHSTRHENSQGIRAAAATLDGPGTEQCRAFRFASDVATGRRPPRPGVREPDGGGQVHVAAGFPHSK